LSLLQAALALLRLFWQSFQAGGSFDWRQRRLALGLLKALHGRRRFNFCLQGLGLLDSIFDDSKEHLVPVLDSLLKDKFAQFVEEAQFAGVLQLRLDHRLDEQFEYGHTFVGLGSVELRGEVD